MSEVQAYIESGIIEMYVLGIASTEEMLEVEAMAAAHPEVSDAIDAFSASIEQSLLKNAVEPPATVRPFVMATIDYMDRLTKGEQPANPPILTEDSKITDYEEWLNKPQMVVAEDFNGIHARIIAATPAALTAIVWIKEMAPAEVHEDEYEKFLIVEGTCTITIAGHDHYLKAGDYLTIPLHCQHHVKVTSSIPCKIILQRVAA